MMEIPYEAFMNGYPQDAIEFFRDYDADLENERDEYGYKTATKETFKRYDESQKGLSEKIYNKYLRCSKEIHEYIEKGGVI